MADQDDELVEAVRELARTIDDLRQELEASQRGRLRPPMPRPPTPRDLLRFTDDVAVPAAIAVLETSVRALEGFQRALKLARTEREVRDRTTDATSAAEERANDLRRTTLAQLETVLSELQRAASDGTLPADDRARDLLSEARELRDDVDSRLRGVGDPEAAEIESESELGSTDAIRIDIEDGGIDDASGDGPAEDRDDPESNVDVDAELETLKEQYGADEDDEGDEPESVSGDEGVTDADDTDDTDDTDGSDADDSDSDADDNDDGDDENGNRSGSDSAGT